jgi:hypothetical protein
MQVTLDVKELLGKIRALNPESDLRELKAWLFDLVFDEAPAPRSAPTARQVNGGGFQLTPTPRENTEEKNPLPERLLNEVPGIIGEETRSTVKNSSKIVVTGAKKTREERLAKREEVKKFTELSGKEMVDQITDNLISKKEKDGNQFTSEGVDDDGPPVLKGEVVLG